MQYQQHKNSCQMRKNVEKKSQQTKRQNVTNRQQNQNFFKQIEIYNFYIIYAFYNFLLIMKILTCYPYIALLIMSLTLVLPTQCNLESHLKFFEYCTYHNYPVQKHLITTIDLYNLQFHRIQKKNTSIVNLNKVVYLQHGLLDSSDTWIVNDEALAPAFILANQGYDVWVGNTRGNRYSSPTLNPRIKNFWNYSFNQMGLYDLPAAFQYISTKTQQKIHYIGHSQGTTIMLIALASKVKAVEQNIATFIALGPVSYLSHLNSKLMSKTLKSKLIQTLKRLKVKHILFSSDETLKSMSLLMTGDPQLAKTLLYQISEMNNTVNNIDRMKIVFGHFPTGSSLKNLEHFQQFVTNNGSFCKFDYGKKLNLQIYKSEKPPKYDLSKITIPVHLFVGQYDRLATVQDNKRLYNQLINSKKKTMKLLKYGHATFIWGKQIEHMNSIIQIIQSYISIDKISTDIIQQ